MSDSKREASEPRALDKAFGKRYALRARLGAGAFGVVFRARDTMLDRNVAIKQVRFDSFHDKTQAEEFRKRTEREAKMAAKPRHTSIVTIYDIIHTEASTLIIMEFVDGVTLESRLSERGRFGLENICDFVAQTADGLDCAHKQGVVHRDITPGNLMIRADGSVKITDFGSAKSHTGSGTMSHITSPGSVVGTPGYMSPEQVLGKVVDGRSDVFSLACVVYECLTGMKPFRGNEVLDILSQIVDSEPEEIEYESLQIHPDVEPVLTRALAKKPDDRFRTAVELADALRRVPAYESSAACGPYSSVALTNLDPHRSSSFDSDVQGSLAERYIADIVRDIQLGGKNGILHVQHDELSKRLYFLEGSMVFANSDLESERLGQFLIRAGVIDEVMNERALKMMKGTRRRLGNTLVALGSLDEEKLDHLIDDQIHQIIFSVFGWDSGQYGFENVASPVEDDIAVELETRKILLEGVRRMASESAIQRAIGSRDRILQPVDGASADSSNFTLTSAEDFVLSSIDGSWSVAHLAAISPLGEEETLRCVYGLMSAGLLRLRDPKDKASAKADRVNAATAQMPPHMIAKANYSAGKAYFLDKDYHEAAVNFREAVRLAPDKRLYHKALGQALSKKAKSRKQAESEFLRVLELGPDDLEGYLEIDARS